MNKCQKYLKIFFHYLINNGDPYILDKTEVKKNVTLIAGFSIMPRKIILMIKGIRMVVESHAIVHA